MTKTQSQAKAKTRTKTTSKPKSRKKRAGRTDALDPVVMTVIANRLDGIVREMTNTLLRAARPWLRLAGRGIRLRNGFAGLDKRMAMRPR